MSTRSKESGNPSDLRFYFGAYECNLDCSSHPNCKYIHSSSTPRWDNTSSGSKMTDEQGGSNHADNSQIQRSSTDDTSPKWMDDVPDRSNCNIWSTSSTPSESSNHDPYHPHRGTTSNDGNSFYSASTYSGSSIPLQFPSNFLDSTRTGSDLVKTIGQLRLGAGTASSYAHPPSGMIASVPTMGSSSTVPGVVGASSGSTAGNTSVRSASSTWNQQSDSAWSTLRPTQQPWFPNQQQNSQSNQIVGLESGFHLQQQDFGQSPWYQQGQQQQQEDSYSYGSAEDHTYGGHSRSRSKSSRQGNRRHKNQDFKRSRGCGKSRDSAQSYNHHAPNSSRSSVPSFSDDDATTATSSKASSEAIRMLMTAPTSTSGSVSASSHASALTGNRLPLDFLVAESAPTNFSTPGRPILPSIEDVYPVLYSDDDAEEIEENSTMWGDGVGPQSPISKKKEWLRRMNKRMEETPIGKMDLATFPISAIMNAWAKTKSAQGASMVEMWLERLQAEVEAGNTKVAPTTKLFTMAVDAWAKSGEGVRGAQQAEAILQKMYALFQKNGKEELRPTTGIFNAVINAWARSKEKVAPTRAEQILEWMDNLYKSNPSLQIRPDKFTYNTVIHAYAKSGGAAAAAKAQELLERMYSMYKGGNEFAKPDTITFNVCINCWAKSGGNGAALEAERLLARMHSLHEEGDADIKPNVVTYGAVIDSYAKSGEKGAAAKADTLLAKMIQLYQRDPVRNGDLRPNTYVFNTVINCWAKSKEPDAATKAEEMLLAMNKLHASGTMPNLKPDAFTYTAVIDAWSKSGYRGAATRADQLLDKMEAKYLAGDVSLRPNSFTYNAVINALAKSGEPGAAARAERVLQNMVNRHRQGSGDDCKPTTINFNTILDAWAKSGGGRQAAERAEEILEWMDRLHKSGNPDCQPDTISFNAVIDAWARSGDRMAPHRAEQILDHMDELYRAGDKGKKPDVYSYNTLINAWSKSRERGSAARAEHVLRVMKQRYADGDEDFKPNTRTMTSVIDAWAKSGEKGAAKRAEHILNTMIANYEASRDPDVRPNVHTANAVCNACAFTKVEEDKIEALQIAFRVFNWISSQQDMEPDSYTYTILLSVCSNLLPHEDTQTRFGHAKVLFEQACAGGYVNEFVMRKLRQTVSTEEYISLTSTRGETTTDSLPVSWTRSIGRFAKVSSNRGRRKGGNWSQKRGGN